MSPEDRLDATPSRPRIRATSDEQAAPFLGMFDGPRPSLGVPRLRNPLIDLTVPPSLVPRRRYDATHGETPEKPYGSLLDKLRDFGNVPLREAPRDPARRARHEIREADRASTMGQAMDEDRGHRVGLQGTSQPAGFLGTPSAVVPAADVAEGARCATSAALRSLQTLISGPTGAEEPPPPLTLKPGHGDDEVPPPARGRTLPWASPRRF